MLIKYLTQHIPCNY